MGLAEDREVGSVDGASAGGALRVGSEVAPRSGRVMTRQCESCGKDLVEVDNPFRREVRHRRGEEVQCPAWREAAGLPPLAISDTYGDDDVPN